MNKSSLQFNFLCNSNEEHITDNRLRDAGDMYAKVIIIIAAIIIPFAIIDFSNI